MSSVYSLTIYNNDVVVHRRGMPVETDCEMRKLKITELSYKTRRSIAFWSSNLPQENCNSMITLTFPQYYIYTSQAKRRLLNKFFIWLRRRFPEKDLTWLFWFCEYQKRGVPHFHIITDVRPNDFNSPDELLSFRLDLSKYWSDMVFRDYLKYQQDYIFSILSGSNNLAVEHEKHTSAGTNFEFTKSDIRRYAVKYAMKIEQKELPKEFLNGFGMWWGISKTVREIIESTAVTVDCDDSEFYHFIVSRYDKAQTEKFLKYRTLFNVADDFLFEIGHARRTYKKMSRKYFAYVSIRSDISESQRYIQSLFDWRNSQRETCAFLTDRELLDSLLQNNLVDKKPDKYYYFFRGHLMPYHTFKRKDKIKCLVNLS
jgi:hypothetical protein